MATTKKKAEVKFRDPREVAKNLPFLDMSRVLRYTDRKFREDLEVLYELGEDMSTQYACDKTGEKFALHAVVPNKFLFSEDGHMTRIPNADSVIGRRRTEGGWEPVHQPVPVLWISRKTDKDGNFQVVKFPEAVKRSKGLRNVERMFEPLACKHARDFIRAGRGFDLNRVAMVALVTTVMPERRDELLLGRTPASKKPAEVSERVIRKLNGHFGHARVA